MNEMSTFYIKTGILTLNVCFFFLKTTNAGDFWCPLDLRPYFVLAFVLGRYGDRPS